MAPASQMILYRPTGLRERHIIGRIEVIEAYAGPLFQGKIDPETNLPIEGAG